jgi:hypothetical protein
MMPGGHLATSIALSGVAYASTGSIEAAAGCFTGGFLIDADHYLDYLVFEKQWRRPGPISFLRYYFSYSPKKLVLPLHSAEFMTLLLVVIFLYPSLFLAGYWMGALMHLIFDVLVNGDYVIKRAVPFYFFAYRASHGFDAENLLDLESAPAVAGQSPVREFFRWRPVQDEEKEPALELQSSVEKPLL